MSINKFLNIKDNTIEKFNKVAKGKSKEEVRELEMKMLKPKGLEKYFGEIPNISIVDISEHASLKIVFESKKLYDLFCKYFTVRTYVENNICDLSLLEKFLNLLEEGILVYDRKTKELRLNS